MIYMIFGIISSIFTPPLLWLLIFWKLIPPKGKTKAWARADLVLCTLTHPVTYIWAVWVLVWILLAIFAGF